MLIDVERVGISMLKIFAVEIIGIGVCVSLILYL